MTDIIIAIVLLAIMGGVVAYIIKAKKRGVKCIGCPAGGSCSGKCTYHTDAKDNQKNDMMKRAE